MPHQQPDSDAFSDVYGWRYPVCNSTAYRQTLVWAMDLEPRGSGRSTASSLSQDGKRRQSIRKTGARGC